MSPEQAAGHVDEIDTRTDVYSLGVILFRLLTREFPHDMSGTKYEVLRRIAEEEVTRPRALRKDIDRELEALLLKALAHDIGQRYATVSDLAQDIANYLTGEPLKAKKPTTAYFLLKRIRKHRVPVAVGAVVLIALAALAVFAYVRITQERNLAEAAAHKEKVAATKEKTARQDAEAAASSAKRARQDAERRRVDAERARQQEEQQRLLAQQRLYVSDMLLAQQAWDSGNVARLVELLDGQRPAVGGQDLRGFEWYYFRRLCHGYLLTLKGHTDFVNSVTFSPDGTRVASAGDDATVKVWDAATGQEVLTLKGHTRAVTSVAFSPDGERPAPASEDNTVRLWDADTGQQTLTLLRGHTRGM